ncbi:MAG: hypothetical protein ACI31W_01615 [Lactococcus sp.]
MKKIIPLTMIGLSALTLSACSKKDDAAAKKAYINSIVEVSKDDYNQQEVKLKVDKLEVSSDDKSDASIAKMFKDSEMNITMNTNYESRVLDFDGSVKVSGQKYGLNMLMSDKGIYLNSDDLKSIYKVAKPLVNDKVGDYSSIFDSMVDGIDKPYLMMDKASINSYSDEADSDESWSETIDDIFKSQELSKSDIEKEYKDVDNSAFTQKGDEVTFKISEKDVTFDALLKKLPGATAELSKTQLKDLMSQMKDYKVEQMEFVSTKNIKTQETKSTITAKITDDDKNSIDLKLSTDAKASKASKKATEPATSKTMTLEDLQNKVIESLTASTEQAS